MIENAYYKRVGNWLQENQYLVHDHNPNFYIDMDNVRYDVHEMADWIYHCHGKPWMSAQDVYDLITLFRENRVTPWQGRPPKSDKP